MKRQDTIKIAVASGKGGVGKSMLTSSLAILLKEKWNDIVVIDCDVDAPNLDVWLGEVGEADKTTSLETSSKAFVDTAKCTGCGICEERCVFKAIEVKDSKAQVSPFTCEGCGRCVVNCPAEAIQIKPVKNGCINTKKTKYGFPLISGQLYPGETGSGKIIDAVKEQALKDKKDIAIIDSSPGTGCPVTSALRDVNYVILITEPSPSGFQDLKRVLEVVNHFRIEYGIVVNKWDIHKPLADKIEAWAGTQKYLGKISYDQNIMKAIGNLQPIPESSLPANDEILNIFNNLISKKIFQVNTKK